MVFFSDESREDYKNNTEITQYHKFIKNNHFTAEAFKNRQIAV